MQSQEASSSSSGAGGSSLQKNKPVNRSSENFKFPFICECFFMTARVLNLGLLKAISHNKHLYKEIFRCENSLSSFKQEQAPSPQLQQLENELLQYKQENLCYEAQIDEGILQRALSYYHLMVVWLVGLVGGFNMPQTLTCPKEFACMPEHFVEDTMELLFLASGDHGDLDRAMLADYMNFITMFVASPEYIRNPYLRGKMVKVLSLWVPDSEIELASGSKATESFFEGSQLSIEYLVKNLLKYYVDIEFQTQLDLVRN